MMVVGGEGNRRIKIRATPEGYIELRNNPALASSVSTLGRCKSAGITTPEIAKGKVDHVGGLSAVGFVQ